MKLPDMPSTPPPDLPAPPPDSPWTVVVEGVDDALEPIRDARLTLVGGATGTLGSPLASYPPAVRGVYVAGVYTGDGAESTLARLPDWAALDERLDERAPVRRVLDMRAGLLHHALATERGRVRAVSFASRARPGIGALRALGSGLVSAPDAGSGAGAGLSGSDVARFYVPGGGRGASVAVADTVSGRGESRCLDRVAAVKSGSRRSPSAAGVRALLETAQGLGWDRLLAEHRAAWDSRWADADIVVEGDPDMQRAIRYALYQLMAHEVERGESAIGARGVTGPKYRGHVFWDTDVYVLPFFAAVRPRAARSVLEYRVRRLDAARSAARAAGFAGARFPWESAADGRDVTPASVPRPDGPPIEVLTGPYELHIVADVAWAAATYVDWSGDAAFAAGPGADLMFETARFWASRVERAADGSAHISRITGPDEYHNFVVDNAYTNVMARWNLRRAAAWKGDNGPGRTAVPDGSERAAWLDLADRLVDGFDVASGLYEQFRGYFDLEPVKIAELAQRPLSGEVYLGRDRVAGTQCVKQPDTLLLYQLVPAELRPETLGPNLDFYDARTSHGSTLSPGVHAALLAQAGRTEEALDALRMIAFVDLDDASRGTAEGLHMAALGSLWQAMAFGFAGLRLEGDGLAVDPHLPAGWRALEVPVRLRGRRVRVRVEPDRLEVRADRPVVVRIAGLAPTAVERNGIRAIRRGGGWALP
jgi:trehalose/maltose hydrolase-like predicted phosphorylase